MAGTQIKAEHNAPEIREVFSALLAAVDNLEPLWRDVGEHLLLSHRFRFDVAIAPDGTPWEPLDPDYQRRKKRRQDDILVLDAYLRDQLTYHASPVALEFGSNRVHAATHQFGDPDRNIPQREFLGLSTDDLAEILSLAQQHLSDAIQAPR